MSGRRDSEVQAERVRGRGVREQVSDLPANRYTVTSEEVVESWGRDIQGPNRGFTSSAAAYAKVVLESSFAGSKRSGVAAIDAQIENWEEAVEKVRGRRQAVRASTELRRIELVVFVR